MDLVNPPVKSRSDLRERLDAAILAADNPAGLTPSKLAQMGVAKRSTMVHMLARAHAANQNEPKDFSAYVAAVCKKAGKTFGERVSPFEQRLRETILAVNHPHLVQGVELAAKMRICPSVISSFLKRNYVRAYKQGKTAPLYLSDYIIDTYQRAGKSLTPKQLLSLKYNLSITETIVMEALLEASLLPAREIADGLGMRMGMLDSTNDNLMGKIGIQGRPQQRVLALMDEWKKCGGTGATPWQRYYLGNSLSLNEEKISRELARCPTAQNWYIARNMGLNVGSVASCLCRLLARARLTRVVYAQSLARGEYPVLQDKTEFLMAKRRELNALRIEKILRNGGTVIANQIIVSEATKRRAKEVLGVLTAMEHAKYLTKRELKKEAPARVHLGGVGSSLWEHPILAKRLVSRYSVVGPARVILGRLDNQSQLNAALARAIDVQRPFKSKKSDTHASMDWHSNGWAV